MQWSLLTAPCVCGPDVHCLPARLLQLLPATVSVNDMVQTLMRHRPYLLSPLQSSCHTKNHTMAKMKGHLAVHNI